MKTEEGILVEKVTLELHINADAAIRVIGELTESIKALSEKLDTQFNSSTVNVKLSCGAEPRSIDSVIELISDRLQASLVKSDKELYR